MSITSWFGYATYAFSNAILGTLAGMVTFGIYAMLWLLLRIIQLTGGCLPTTPDTARLVGAGIGPLIAFAISLHQWKEDEGAGVSISNWAYIITFNVSYSMLATCRINWKAPMCRAYPQLDIPLWLLVAGAMFLLTIVAYLTAKRLRR